MANIWEAITTASALPVNSTNTLYDHLQYLQGGEVYYRTLEPETVKVIEDAEPVITVLAPCQ